MTKLIKAGLFRLFDRKPAEDWLIILAG